MKIFHCSSLSRKIFPTVSLDVLIMWHIREWYTLPPPRSNPSVCFLLFSGVTPLKPTFREIAESRTVDMWSNQLFSCVFTSDPRSIFAWSKELPIVDGGLRLGGGNFHILRNRSLQIQNVTWNDRGKYFCNAMNSEGITTRRVELNVNGRPFHISHFLKETTT